MDGWGFLLTSVSTIPRRLPTLDSLASPVSPLRTPELASPDFLMGASQDMVERGFPGRCVCTGD